MTVGGPSRAAGRTERGSPRFTLREPQGERNAAPPGSPFESLRANGSRLPPVGPSRASGRTERGPRGHPSRASSQALRVASGRTDSRLRRFTLRFPSGRTERGSPRFTLREPQGERTAGSPRFTLREPQGERNAAPPVGPSRASGRTERGSARLSFECCLRANGTRLGSVHPSRASGRTERGSARFTLRESQGERNAAPQVGPSRASGRTERGSARLSFECCRRATGTRLPRLALREPQGERRDGAHEIPGFTGMTGWGREGDGGRGTACAIIGNNRA